MQNFPRRVWPAALVGASAAVCWLTPLGAAEKASESAKHAEAASGDFATLLFVLMLATLIGLGVITRVSRLLHTPLMSLTNAISAIAIVGAILVAGPKYDVPNSLAYTIVGSLAVAASMTNIVSGFLITDRMLKMFKQREPK